MMNKAEFEAHWKSLPEDQAAHAVDAAWRRYQEANSAGRDESDPSEHEFQSMFKDFLRDTAINDAVAEYKFITLAPNRLPWTSTGIRLRRGQTTSTFASGRVWRSRELDLWLRPQFALWFRVGVNERVFNSTADTNTFIAEDAGELYVANQFPGQFGEPYGGRLASPLTVYDKAEGGFQILFVVWKDGLNAQEVMNGFYSSSPRPPTLLGLELHRIHKEAQSKLPQEWRYLWFLGQSSIYSMVEEHGNHCMHCKPYLNTGILQKTFDPPIAFESTTVVSWDWLITALPSRLREDLTFTHDYLSVAFEFENGRDLTYTWSWELDKDFGYWCPLPAWQDREYHIVIRSGTTELGQWLSESRNLYTDYMRYIEEGSENPERVPLQIVRVWFIAGNRWQRFDGEMSVKKLQICQRGMVVNVL